MSKTKAKSRAKSEDHGKKNPRKIVRDPITHRKLHLPGK